MRKPAALCIFTLACVSVAAHSIPRALAAQKATTRHVSDPDRELQKLLVAGQTALDRKDYSVAADAYSKYLEKKPDDAVAHFQLGYAFTALAKLDDAREEYRKAAELNPRMPEAQLNYGLAVFEKDSAAAVEPLRRAVALMPGQARPLFALGLALERSGQLAPAIEQYKQAKSLDAKNFDIRFAMGRALLAANRPAEAETEFRSALALKFDSAPSHLGLAESLIAQQKLQPAASALAVYLKAKPDDAASRVQYASVLADLGKDDEALAELDRAGPQAADSPKGLKMRGELLMHEMKFAEAAPYLQKAVALNPEDATLHARMGSLWLAQNKYPDASREFSAALKIDLKNLDALRGLLYANYYGQNYTAALALLDRLAAQEAPTDKTWFIRADCYDKLGQKAEALVAYDKFLSLHAGTNDDAYFAATARKRALEREVKRKKP